MRTLAGVVAVGGGALLASPSALAQQSPGEISPAASAVWVHIDGSADATLQRDDGDRWRNVCKAPCNQAVSASPRYRIGGDGLQNTKPFVLRGERETLHVDESPQIAFEAGIAATIAGGIGMNIGLTACLLSNLDQSPTTERVGLTIVGVSLAAIVGGIVTIATNAHSGVTQGAESSPAARLPVREPPPEAASIGGPPAIAIPIASGRF